MSSPAAYIRRDRHVAAYVSLGRGRLDLQPVAPIASRISTQVSSERQAAQA